MYDTCNMDAPASALIELTGCLNSPRQDDVLLAEAGVSSRPRAFSAARAAQRRLGMSVANLADQVGRDASTVSRQLAKLEDFGLIRRPAARLDPKVTDVNRLMADMEELIKRTMGPAIQLEVVGAAGLWATLVDPSQLENAVLNLCLNARDAMPRNHEVPLQGVEEPLHATVATPGDGEVVLVIDDEPSIRMLISEVLDEAGYTAIEVGDGPAGLRILQSNAKIDLLITDVGLPGGINGRQVADVARRIRPTLKVLFITGYAENAVISHQYLQLPVFGVASRVQDRPIMRRLRLGHFCFFILVAMTSGDFSLAIERADFSIVKSEPPYQVREYSPVVSAYVDVSGDRSEAVNAGFRLLANYIFGDNDQKAKIAMTAPVTQNPQSAEINQSQGVATDAWVVRFMMPSGYTLESLPKARDARVHFEATPARRVASIQFSGFWSDANLSSHETMLRQWMARNHLAANSQPTYAYYDPPWTPWFMRTIEVMVDVQPSP